MSGLSTKTKGRGAPAATASSAVPDPGAHDSGQLDAATLAAISEHIGETPDPATEEETAPAASAPPVESTDSDESADDTSTEPEAEGATPEAAETTTATEPAAESEASPEAEATAEDDTPAWAKKRFAELTSQLRQVRAENESLRTQATAPAAARPPSPDADIIAVETPEQLAQLREQFERIEEFAELHPDGVEADPDKPGSRAFSREELVQARINARRKLRELEGRGRQLEHQQRFNAAAHQLFPAFNDADSEEARALNWVLQQVPELRRLPNYRIVIGDSIAHARLRQKQAEARQKQGTNGQPLAGKPAAPVRKAPPGGPAAPVRSSAAPEKSARLAPLKQRAYRSGSESDLASLVEAAMG